MLAKAGLRMNASEARAILKNFIARLWSCGLFKIYHRIQVFELGCESRIRRRLGFKAGKGVD